MTFGASQELCSYLDSLVSNTKVRVVFGDYELWRTFLPLEQKYKDKFIVFRQKKEFIQDIIQTVQKTDSKQMGEALIEWMNKNKIEKKIQEILLEKIK